MNDRKWFNIGSRDGYLEVHRMIAEDGWRPAYLNGEEWPVRVAKDAVVEPGAKFSGFYSIGSGSRIGV